MRTLLLLRGAPASGKSTFIREHHLEPYTLSADDFRLKATSPELNKEGFLSISQNHDTLAWHMLYQSLESRMIRGDFTIIDATHCSPYMISRYHSYLEKYRYYGFYLDFDAPLDELLRRNQTRSEYQFVPEDTIKRMHTMFHHVKPQKYFHPIHDIREILNFWTEDLTDTYDTVKVIGDVHGCWSVLKEAIFPLDEHTKYVFVGDFLERGIENKEVLDFLLNHYRDKNITLIMGNHDEYLWRWAFNYMRKEYSDGLAVSETFLKTIDHITETMDEQQRKKFRNDLKDVTRKFYQCYAFTFHGKNYFVNHGGVPSLPSMTLIPTVQLTKGVGKYSLPIDEIYEKNYQAGRCQNYTQLHGHRLSEDLDLETYDGTAHSISLEGKVELGKYLKVYELTKDGGRMLRYRNTVFNPKWKEVAPPRYAAEPSPEELLTLHTANPTTNAIADNAYVKVKAQDDHNLASLNFTTRAFRKGVWNSMTVRARGLFVDRTSGDIKLRSYNKFFNLQEREETSLRVLSETLAFPLKVYRKQNGFLGILSVVDGDLVLASKSKTTGPYADMFREIFMTLDPREQQALKDTAETYHCSFLFEVCHLSDRHIIDFTKNHLWLLDAVPNTYDIGGKHVNETFSETMKAKIPILSGVMQKKVLLFTANTLDEVIAYAKKHHHDRTIEGVVCQDRNGYMFKVKFHYYTVMKKLRGAFYSLQSGKRHGDIRWGQFRDERTLKFVSYFYGLPFEQWRDLHIIDAIKEYEAHNGLLMALEP